MARRMPTLPTRGRQFGPGPNPNVGKDNGTLVNGGPVPKTGTPERRLAPERVARKAAVARMRRRPERPNATFGSPNPTRSQSESFGPGPGTKGLTRGASR